MEVQPNFENPSVHVTVSIKNSSVHSDSVRVDNGDKFIKDDGEILKGNWVKGNAANLFVTYSWKDINVWTGPPDKEVFENGIGHEGNVQTEKTNNSFISCCKRNHLSKQLLKNVTGFARPGELLAIMGASGAGKTTLLNCLNFRNTGSLHVSGQRFVNGCPVGLPSLTSLSAYIQQEDLFIGTLTVREQLTFQALVRMEPDIPYKIRMSRVDQVIKEFSLTKCEHTKIGIRGRLKGISGGEMKRLAFACEVLTDPPLMFCDEPTSGLDSYMAEQIVLALKELTSKGKTIICTIHQPSSQVYAMFHRLMLMAEGRVAFMGSTSDAIVFFERNGFPCPINFNPADFFVQTLAIQPDKEIQCKKVVKAICDNFESGLDGNEIRKTIDSLEIEKTSESYLKEEVKAKKISPYKVSWIRQFRAVFWRSWIAFIKNPFILPFRLVQTIFLSLIIGLVYHGQENDQDGVQNINGVLFLILTNITLQNVFSVVDVFCMEIPIFLREHFNGMYRTDVYFLAKMIAELPFYIVLPLIFISINYFIIGLNSEMKSFLTIAGVIVMVTLFANSLGYFISCIASSMTVALIIGPALIIPFYLFSGFLLNTDSIPQYLVWIKYLSWFYYGNEALSIAQWDSIDVIHCSNDPIKAAICPRNGSVVLRAFNYKRDNFTRDIFALLGLTIGCRILAFLALLSKTRRQ